MGSNLLKTILVIAITSLVLFGIAAEILLRARCTYCTWTEQNAGKYQSPYQEPYWNTWYHLRAPNAVDSYKQPEFDYEIKTNSFGIRDVEHPVEKAEDEFRIIALGDSFTEGQGASYEDTYVRVLERKLNGRVKGSGIRVINGGVAGSDPFYSYRLLQDKLLRFKPDLVTLAVNDSDVMDTIVRGGKERFLPNGQVKYAEPPDDEWLFARSHLYRFITREFYDYDWIGLSPSAHALKTEEALVKMKHALADLKDLSAREGFEFVVVLHPGFWELMTNHYTFNVDVLKDYMRRSEIKFIDLLPYFRETMPPEEKIVKTLFWEKDYHHNAEGYRRFAEALVAYIFEHDLIKKRSAPGR